MKLLDKEDKKLYTNLTDEEIIKLYRTGDESALDFLLNKHKSLATKISRSYFLVGAESEDLLQEAMLGLYSACRKFDERLNASFKTFATICITRAVQSAVKMANRQKNRALNESYSLTNQGTVVLDESDIDGELCLYVPSQTLPPEDAFMEMEREQEINKLIEENLSKKEKSVLALYLKGLSYMEIASALGENTKSVDNAIARTKKKLEEVL